MASIAYGEPRFTNDIDIVAKLTADRVEAFCAAFPAPDFYCSLETARHAVANRFQFHVLHLPSGLKANAIVAADTPFEESRFARGQLLPTDQLHEAWFASAEDVILKKLLYFQEGGSEKHLRDIVGILKLHADVIEHDYLARWIMQLDVTAEWQLVQSRLSPPNADRVS